MVRGSVTVGVLVVIVMGSIAMPGAVAAQDEVVVSLVPSEDEIQVGETGEYEIVVDGLAGGGVGAIDVVVNVNRTIATLGEVSFNGNPGFNDVSYQANQTEVRLRAALMDTADAGRVTIGSITVHAENEGAGTLGLSVIDIGSEEGVSYSIGESRASELRVITDSESGTSVGTSTTEPTSSNAGDAGQSSSTTRQAGTSTEDMNPISRQIDVHSVGVTTGRLVVGQETTFEATVENIGEEQASMEAVLELSGDSVAAKTVQIDANAKRTINFTHTMETPGEARIYIDNQMVYSGTVETQPANSTIGEQTPTDARTSLNAQTTTAGTPSETTTAVPGFSIGATGIALVCTLLLRYRRGD